MASPIPLGGCCARDLCLYPALAVGDTHKCLACNNGMHALCCIKIDDQSPTSDFIVTINHLPLSTQMRLNEPSSPVEKILCRACYHSIKQKSNSDTTTTNHSGKFSIGDGVLVSGINCDGEGKRFSGTVIGVSMDNGNILYDVEFWEENSPEGPFEEN